jgi:hypothetical protein
MFNRRSAKSPYSLKQTIFWLTWLAHNMHRHNQLIFSLDTIDSSWLQTWPQKVIFAFFILFAILPILLALNLLVKFSIPVEILIWFSEEAKKGLLGLGVNTLLGGLIGGLISTLLVVVGHLLFRTQSLVSRLILAYQGYIPWNFPHFLDYATERILLRKVGDGYTFIHRLLLEYFASLGQQEGK